MLGQSGQNVVFLPHIALVKVFYLQPQEKALTELPEEKDGVCALRMDTEDPLCSHDLEQVQGQSAGWVSEITNREAERQVSKALR